MLVARVPGLLALVGLVACSSAGKGSEPIDASIVEQNTTVIESTVPTPAREVDVTLSVPATASTPTVASTSSTIPPPDDPHSYDFLAVDPIVQQFIDEHGLNGAGLIVVERDDGVIHEDYWGEFTSDRISLVASSSKMIVAGVLLHLQDRGLLDIDAPVAEVAPWGSGNPEITPAQLVSNSSGLVGLSPNPAYGPYVCQFLPAGTLQDCAEAIFTTTDDDRDVIPPDSEYRYGGAQWQIAGAVAEVASGRSWAELIDRVYVEPCQLDTLGFNNHWTQFGGEPFTYPVDFDADPATLVPTENPNMEAGAFVTTGDYAKLLLMQLRDGYCGDTEVLSTESLRRMHEDRTGRVYGSDVPYGMGWWVDRDNGRLRDPGAYGSVAWLDLDDRYGAYLVIEADGALGGALAAELYDVIDVAVAAAR
jgi:CubicO group peptidase (beta-lactamase class C family)